MAIGKRSENYALLMRKLDEFRRKYYLNKLIRGSIISLAAILLMYLAFSLLEYQFYFSSLVRKTFFFGFLGGSAALLARLVLLPVMQYFRLGKIMGSEQAAVIIGKHFEEVEDRLLNVLQLSSSDHPASDRSLIEASIDQKIEKLKPIPFSLAIDLGNNRRYARYALLPSAALIFIVFAAPDILRESNERLLKNNRYFEKEAPFRFIVKNKDLQVVQHEDFELNVEIAGKALPEEVYLDYGDYSFKMQRMSNSNYSYKFNKLQENIEFHLSASGFRSEDFELSVIPKPMIIHFEMELDYPAYTGRKDELLKNVGDAVIPYGTKVGWRFSTENTDRIFFHFDDSLYRADRRAQDAFVMQKQIFDNQAYKIHVENEMILGSDSISYMFGIIPDLYPNVRVEQFEDSLNRKFLYFMGDAEDDYGLRKLNFHFMIETPDKKGSLVEREKGMYPIPLESRAKSEQFTHSFDLTTKDLKPGDRVTYYFEVWDNDGIGGSKSSRTAKMIFEMPSLKEFEERTEKRNEEIKDEMEDALKDIEEVKEEIQDLKERLLQKKEVGWEDKKAIEDLLNKQNEIKEQVDEVKEMFNENLREQSEYKEEISDRLLEKQKRLQDMFEEVLTDEMKELFEELEELLEQMNKEQSLEELENMELNDEQLESELDRMLELFKQLEFEQKMEDLASKFEELSGEQEELSKESDEKDADVEDVSEQQEEINQEFDELSKEFDELKELNEGLQGKQDMQETEQTEQEISESLEKSMEQLQKQKMNKASQQQQQSAEKMDQMAQQMQQMLSMMQQQQMTEDMQALRQLLDNLIKLSFDQEGLMEDFKQIRVKNPGYVELVQEQYKLKEDAEMVEDSLISLSKRVFEISTFVTREIAEINKNMDKGLENLNERRLAKATVNQQYIMTGVNNLALMLDEVLQQMQQQMAMSMPGSQMCQKPNGNSSQLPNLGNLQKQLNDQIKQLKEQMGKMPGQSTMSKQLAESAARQAAIRDALRKMADKMAGDQETGEFAKELREIAEDMDKTEEQLVNKILSEEMLKRQEEILTRLLEAADAERERELDPERKSNVADQISRDVPPSLEEYLKKRQAEVDLYKSVPANLKPYYRLLVEDYIKAISF